jgi:hypothetical protein
MALRAEPVRQARSRSSTAPTEEKGRLADLGTDKTQA